MENGERREILLLQRDPAGAEHRRLLRAAAAPDAAQLLVRLHRQKDPQVVAVPQGWVAGVGPLHHGQRRSFGVYRVAQRLPPAQVGAECHRQTLPGGAQHLRQKALVIHVFAGVGQPFRRALHRPEEEVVHVEHAATQLLLKTLGQRGLAGAAAAVDGDEQRRALQTPADGLHQSVIAGGGREGVVGVSHGAVLLSRRRDVSAGMIPHWCGKYNISAGKALQLPAGCGIVSTKAACRRATEKGDLMWNIRGTGADPHRLSGH